MVRVRVRVGVRVRVRVGVRVRVWFRVTVRVREHDPTHQHHLRLWRG